jgi:hypothetical protein
MTTGPRGTLGVVTAAEISTTGATGVSPGVALEDESLGVALDTSLVGVESGAAFAGVSPVGRAISPVGANNSASSATVA